MGKCHHHQPETAHMRRAVQLSEETMKANLGGPFGAVIVKDGQIIAEGYNQVTSSNDPTAHAEIVAIRRACKKLGTFSLEGCELYTSCEPCPMCLASIYWARLDALYFANSRQEAADIGFDDQFLYLEIPKPLSERKIPTQKIELDEARAVFEVWRAKPDKITY